MPNIGFRIAAILLDALVLASSGFVFAGMAAPALEDYPSQIFWLVLPSLICSVSLAPLADRNRLFLIIACSFKSILLSLIIMTLPVIDLRLLPIILSYAALLTAFCGIREILVMHLLWIGLALVAVTVFPTIDFGRRVNALETGILSVSALFALVSSAAARASFDKRRTQDELVSRLRGEIVRIADANIGFQEYSSLVEAHTLRAERDRLSREIHDSAGYALTTLKMTFEAARGIKDREPDRLDGILEEGSRLAEEALGEIRRAMRNLRGRPDDMPNGMAFVIRLVRNFEAVTKVAVDVDFSNSRGTYGKEVDPILYKMVQEGLINAYRHGHATRVGMTLREAGGCLSVRIKDNGVSPKKLVKGIGLEGMEERISEAGGTIDFSSGESGFEIRASIPLGRGGPDSAGG